ncbi:MAG: rhomboid family intramembrane serine protease [Prolixibacteraceae bacterium]|jgi:membrane associated rhomboid family serine protease|nr:rhomboid family intramembrane serine protease [Prolixibacteraceae bacterium]
MSIIDEIKGSFREGSTLTRLIYINIGVFLLIRVINVFYFLSGQEFSLINWLAMPADVGQLLSRPWTIITYMFLHFGFLHILFNILWLYWLGRIFLSYFDGQKLLSVYLLGGISGGLFYLLAYNLFPAFENVLVASQLLGASAAVIAIVIAVGVYVPNHVIYLMFIGPVKMKYIALVSVVMYIIGISTSNAGGNLAHLGGAFLGMIFALQYKKGTDISKGLNLLIDTVAKWLKPKPKVKITYRSAGNRDIDYNRRKNAQQEQINEILEKISKSGYDSLSREEKEILFRMGK